VVTLSVPGLNPGVFNCSELEVDVDGFERCEPCPLGETEARERGEREERERKEGEEGERQSQIEQVTSPHLDLALHAPKH
jgi:hypothetical protein